LLHFAALGPWLYLDIFRRETEQTFFSHNSLKEMGVIEK
jgi:hypothetical protein